MNKIYKVVWNQALAAWVAVSELAVRHGKPATVAGGGANHAARAEAAVFNLKALALGLLLAMPAVSHATLAGNANSNGGFIYNSTDAAAASAGGSSSSAFNYYNPYNYIYPASTFAGYSFSQISNLGYFYSQGLSASQAIALGRYANAYNGGIALGDYAYARASAANLSVNTGAGLGVAIGSYSSATGSGAIAMGTSAAAQGNASLAVMRQATAVGNFSMAFGSTSAAVGLSSTAIGQSATSVGKQSVAIGSSNVGEEWTLTSNVSMYRPDSAAQSLGDRSIAIGSGAVTGVALKDSATGQITTSQSANDSVAMGSAAKAQKDTAVAIGSSALAGGTGSFALGGEAQASGDYAVAIGSKNATAATGTVAGGQDSVAVGSEASAGGVKSMALGKSSVASNDGSVAFGANALSSGTNAVAVGLEANATGVDSLALGTESKSTADNAVSIGDAANASAENALALGGKAQATAVSALALGSGAQSTVAETVAIGAGAVASQSGALAIGANAVSDTYNSLALGSGTEIKSVLADGMARYSGDANVNSENGVVAVGNTGSERRIINVAGGENDTDAVNLKQLRLVNENLAKTIGGEDYTGYAGDNATYEAPDFAIKGSTYNNVKDAVEAAQTNYISVNSTERGAGSNYSNDGASAANALAAGAFAMASSENGTAIGYKANANADNAVAIGAEAHARGDDSVALGSSANAVGTAAIAAGLNAVTNKDSAIAIGNAANAGGTDAVAIGSSSVAGGESAVAIGKNAQATALNTISIGNGNLVSGQGSSAVGDPSIVAGTNSLSAGNNNAIGSSTDNSFILGGQNNLGGEAAIRNANGVITTSGGIRNVVDASNSAIIGYKNSVQDTNVFVMGNNVTVDRGMGGAVVLGNESAADAYVQTTEAEVGGVTYGNFAGSGVLTDGSIVSVGAAGAERQIKNVAAGQISAASTDAINGSQLYAVAEEASKGINFGDGATSNKYALGDTINVKGDSNVTSTTTADGVQLGLADNISVTSVTAGNTVLNNDGVTISGGPSMTSSGIDAGGNTITNVAAGVNDTDAVNMSQLNAIAANQNVAKVEAGNNTRVTSTVNGNTTTYTVNAEKSTVTAGSTAVAVTSTTDSATDVTDYQVDLAQSTKDDIQKGVDAKDAVDTQGLTFTGDSGTTGTKLLGSSVAVNGDDNITTTADANGVKVELNKQLDLTDAGSVTVGNTVLNNDGVTIANGPSITTNGIDAGGDKITNVAAGDVSATSTDAVNGSQLYTTNQNVTTNADNIAQNTSDIADNAAAIDKGINFGDGATSNKYALGDTINVKGDSNVTSTTTADGVQLGLADTVAIGTSNPVTINGDSGTVGGLTNTVWNANNITSGQAATEDQLKAVSDVANQGFNLTTSASDGTVTGTTVEQIQAGETVTVDAGKNIAVTQNGNSISIATADDLIVDSVTTGNTLLDNGGVTISGGANGTVSLGNSGLNNGGNTITNVAAGVNDTDAVNVGQLNMLGNSTAASLGGSSSYDAATNTVTAGLDVGGTTYGSVQDALNQINATASGGWNLATDNGTASNVAAGDTVIFGNQDGNVTVSNNGNNVTVDLAKDISVDSVTAGDTTLNTDGVTVGDKVALTKDGLSVGDVSVTESGLDNGGNKITNIAAGTDDTDAVNVSQLKAAQAASTTKVAAGDNIDVTTATNADGSTTYTVATKKDLTVDSVTAGDTTVNNDGVSIADGPSITKDGIDAAGNKVTNVAAGDISASSTDAVNGGQLYETNTQVSANTEALKKGLGFTADSGNTVNRQLGDTVAIIGDGNIKTATTADGVQVTLSKDLTVDSVKAGNTTVDNSGVKVGDSVALTESGLNNGGNTITNVGEGVNGTDAVNVNQLNKLAGNINNINNRINGVEDNANAGTAAAMAVAGLPQAYLPGKSMVAIAGGVYRGESGYALGFSSISDGGNWVIKGTASGNSRGHYGATAGVGYQW